MFTKEGRLRCLDNRTEGRYLRDYAAVLLPYKLVNVNMTSQPASMFETETVHKNKQVNVNMTSQPASMFEMETVHKNKQVNVNMTSQPASMCETETVHKNYDKEWPLLIHT
jgi:hypothetical protein